MKPSFFFNAQVALTALFLIVCTNGFSQKTAIWKGGTPGRENDWHCPKNWGAGAVPDAFSNVIIPDVFTTTLAPPVIRKGRVEINALYLDAHVVLTIEQPATLVVVETAEGISDDTIRLKGEIQLPRKAAVKRTAEPVSAMRR